MISENDTVESLALLGDEAIALGAMHAGLSAAYGYPGTPSTEILTYLIGKSSGKFTAKWCSNEKTAMEAALGASFSGKRALVTTKHVGINVAADPFMSAALLDIHGGLVIVVADDPGMHSSQGEQDSRFYSSFAMIPCLEPRNQQEAYDMCREAFFLSEMFHIPVLLRLVTRLAHARAAVKTLAILEQNPLSKMRDKTRWMLIPVFARRNYAILLDKQKDILEWSLSNKANNLEIEGRDQSFAIITSGLGGNYYEDNLDDLVKSRGGKKPAHLHIGTYPIPQEKIRRLCEKAEKVLVIEEGQPFIEERLRGILPQNIVINGKLDGTLVRSGELDPDNVRKALNLSPRPSILENGLNIPALPGRPPQLCRGCSHIDSYKVLNEVVAKLDPIENRPNTAICSDIGCYSLGATPPYNAIETVISMGASIGMARGAADAGMKYSLAVIGDSTFFHSGITCLVDAVQSDVPITVIILDNSAVAMTGCQETIVPSDDLKGLVLGLGVKKEHYVELEASPRSHEGNVDKLKMEIEYRGVSVVVFRRECLEVIRKRRKS